MTLFQKTLSYCWKFWHSGLVTATDYTKANLFLEDVLALAHKVSIANQFDHKELGQIAMSNIITQPNIIFGQP